MAGAEGGLRDGTLRHNATPDGSSGGDPAKTDRRAMLDEWRKQMRAKEGGGTGTTTPAGGGTPARPVGSARPPSASFEDGHDKKRARMNDDAHDGGGGGAGAGPLPLPPQQHLPPVAPLPAQPPMAAPSPPTAGDVGGGTALERFKARQALRQQREQQMAAGCDDHLQQHHAMPPLPPAAAAAAAGAPTRSAICYDDDEDDHHHHPADQDADHDNRSVASGRSHHSAASGRGRGGGGTASRGATPSRAAGTPLRGRAGRMSLIGVGAARKPAKANGGAAGGGSRRQTMAASGGRVGSSTPTSGMAHAHNSGAASATLPPAPGEYTDVCTHMHIAMLPSPCILLVSNI